MGELIKIDKNNILSIFHGHQDLTKLDDPFTKKIYLLDVHIAGTGYIENIKEIEPQISSDMTLKFFRESDNLHDPFAIVIKNQSGQKLGYVPHNQNLVLARLMDAGKLLYGVVQTKEFVGEWLKITIKVFLKD